MSWFNRMRYPRTQSGRRAYIQDGMKSYRCKFPFLLLIVIGVAGMILSLIWCFKGHGSYLVVILSMGLFILGLQGLQLKDEPTHVNQQEIDEMIERKRRES